VFGQFDVLFKRGVGKTQLTEGDLWQSALLLALRTAGIVGGAD
jgi:hypothetical protein